LRLIQQGEVSKPTRQFQTVLRPIVRSVLADDVRNPSTFGDSIGFGRLLDKRLRGVIQIQGDLRHIHLL
jgi:hypothetical protein